MKLRTNKDGFQWAVISREAALALWDYNVCESLYMLNDDDTESAVNCKEDIAEDLEFGVELGWPVKKESILDKETAKCPISEKLLTKLAIEARNIDGDSSEPLDGDAVDLFIDELKYALNKHEGNE